MLAPLRPQPGHPFYEERLRQFRRDTADKKTNPRNWGQVMTLPSQAQGEKSPARGRKKREG